jgi:uncharacterized protein with ATP-grasp and redox domains
MPKHFPPPIISTEPGSWSHSTVTIRWPDIAQRVINENDYPSAIIQKINDLQDEILGGRIRDLQDPEAPDLESWRKYLRDYLGKSWQEVPWFFAEHYFYRRIMEAVGYFNSGKDPYHLTKKEGLITNAQDITMFCQFISDSLSDDDMIVQNLFDVLYFSLWGNQADLSLWPAGGDKDPKHSSSKILKDFLLEDHSKQVINRISKSDQPLNRIDIMLDNAGFELVTDLGLADVLLSGHLVQEVVLHVKSHPTFVSDVILDDLDQTVAYLVSSDDRNIAAFGDRLQSHFKDNRIIPKENFFWNSPLAMWELPQKLRKELAKSSLLISKGDANYRRLLGDREWDITLPYHQVVDYLPVPSVALRTLKAELAVGLTVEQIQDVFNQDPDWMVDGRWGLIQFAPGIGQGKDL